MASFWGARCCCRGDSTPCEMESCQFYSEEFPDSEVDTDSIICSDGTAAAIEITNDQDTDYGNPAPSRKITFTQTGTATDDTAAYAFCLLKSLSVLSEEVGDLESVDYCIESIKNSLDATTPLEIYAAVRQGTNLFVWKTQPKQIRSSWQPFRTQAVANWKLESNSFEPVFGGLDYSSGAPDLEFGVAVKFVVEAGETDRTAEVHLDNFCINWTTDFICVCSKSSEFQIDIAGIDNTPTAWYETDGSYVVGYNRDDFITVCQWQFVTTVGGETYEVELLIYKTDVIGDNDYRRIRVAFNHFGLIAQYSNRVVSEDPTPPFECGVPITLRKMDNGTNVADFPDTITVTPL